MKILFISKGTGADYLCDMVFHGLRSLFGEDIVDANQLSYMYKGAETDKLYGRGFTLYGLIEEGAVDRTDIQQKIANRYFDLIVFGSVHRCHDYLYEVLAHYPKSNIVFLDGEDGPEFLCDCVNHGHYFKRELYTPQPGVSPIQFAIPEEKIINEAEKRDLMAPIDPLNRATYIYSDERSYYQQYASSMFGKTMKKAGWDCLRHYEIMANMSIPYFQNLDYCPHPIMMNLPKAELLLAKQVLEYRGFDFFTSASGRDLWQQLLEKTHKVLREQLTTKALAKRLIDEVRTQ